MTDQANSLFTPPDRGISFPPLCPLTNLSPNIGVGVCIFLKNVIQHQVYLYVYMYKYSKEWGLAKFLWKGPDRGFAGQLFNSAILT